MGTVLWTRGEGPLVSFAEGFWWELLAQGHPPGGAKHHLVLMGQLDRWLSDQGLGAEDLTPVVAGRFLVSRRAGGQRRRHARRVAPGRRECMAATSGRCATCRSVAARC